MINTLSGQVKIGNNPQTLHPASVLELESSTRALVITRVTTGEMNNINPLAGALVYNTDEDCLHYYNGTEWINICEALDNSFTVSTLALYNVTSRDSTVVITQEDTPDGINYNYEVNKIGSDNITNFSVLNSHIAVETITNDKIQNGTITNAKLDKLSIPLSGFGTPLTDVSMGNAAKLTNLQNPTAPQDAATKSYVDNLADDDITGVTFNTTTNQITVTEGATSFSANLSSLEESADITANTANITANTTAINNHIAADGDLSDTNEIQNIEEVLADGNDANGAVITGLGTPTAATDAATKAYVDALDGSDDQDLAIGAGGTPTESVELTITDGASATIDIRDADPDPLNEIQNIEEVLADGNDANGAVITGLGTPTAATDAATKAYVDGINVSQGAGITVTTPAAQEFNVAVTNPVIAIGRIISGASTPVGATVTNNTGGSYTVNLSTTPTNYVVQLTVDNNTGPRTIQLTNQAASSFSVQIYNAGATSDSDWSFTVISF